MTIVDGKVILGERACYCMDGKVWDIKYCRNHTKAQGWHNCNKKTCPNNPSKRSGWHELSKVAVPCPTCNGTNIVPENYTDYISLPTDFPVIIFRSNRGNTWNESYLGMGCVYSCTDYGRMAQASDEAVAGEVRTKEHLHMQACKVVKSKDDLTLCDALGVYVTRDGYSVRPYFQEEGEKQFSGVDGRALGMAVYAAGGNGTLAAGFAE